MMVALGSARDGGVYIFYTRYLHIHMGKTCYLIHFLSTPLNAATCSCRPWFGAPSSPVALLRHPAMGKICQPLSRVCRLRRPAFSLAL